MDLLTPESQESAHYWVSVLLAHGFVGLFLTAALGAALDWIGGDWIDGTGWLALVFVVVCYATWWEMGLQQLGAGWLDAAIDTVAVACGGLAGVSAWARQRVALVVAFVVMASVAAAGVWNRRGPR